MRISDWSSDVCSSDLLCRGRLASCVLLGDDTEDHPSPPRRRHGRCFATDMDRAARLATVDTTHARDHAHPSGSGTGIHARSAGRSEEHTSELQSLMRISYAVFCLRKTKQLTQITNSETLMRN